MLLNLKCLIFRLKSHADIYIKSCGLLSSLAVVCILHIATSPLAIKLSINEVSNKLCIQILQAEEATRAVNHWAVLTRSVYHKEWSDTCCLSYAVIISTEGWRDMYNTGTVRSCYIVTNNHTECIAILGHRLNPRNKLLVADALQLLTGIVAVSYCKLTLHLLAEECRNKLRSHNNGLTLIGIRVVTLNLYIVDRRTYAKCGI